MQSLILVIIEFMWGHGLVELLINCCYREATRRVVHRIHQSCVKAVTISRYQKLVNYQKDAYVSYVLMP